MSLKELFSEKLKNALDNANMSQRELAEKTNITEVSISRYVLGKRVPTIETLFKIANALGTTPDYLMGLKEHKQTQGDKIRAMSDEELATFLLGFELDCNECMNKYGICVIRKNCRKFAKEWLQSEVKERETE